MKPGKPQQQRKPQTTPTPKKSQAAAKPDLISRLDLWFEKSQKTWMILIMIITFLLGLLLFDIRVSDGGDDSAYIQRAYEFIHDFTYPGFQGALYPMILSIFVLVFGVNLFILKLLSLFFFAGFIWFFFKAGKGKVPASLLIWILLLSALNSRIQFYSSQTYSEPLFMLLQAFLFLVVYKYFITDQQENLSFFKSYKKYLLLGLTLFLLTLTRSIAYASVGAVILYFLVNRDWKSILGALGGFLVFILPYTLLKKLIWSGDSVQFSGQMEMLLHKDPYNFSKGTETLGGFLDRLTSNTYHFLSKIFFSIMGAYDKSSVFRTILILLLIIFAFYWAFKRSKWLLFLGLYILSMLFTTFFLLQKMWQQERLLIVFYPLLLIFILGGFYYFAREKKYSGFQFLIPSVLSFLSLITLYNTMDTLKYSLPNMEEQLQGNIYNGITPDYVNFIKINEWAGKNLPGDSLIASRKPEITFIYSKRKAYGIRTLPYVTRDSVLKVLDPAKKYFILDGVHFDNLPNFDASYPELASTLQVIFRTTKDVITGEPKNEHDYGLYDITNIPDATIVKYVRDNNIQCFEDVRQFLHKADSVEANVTIYDPDKMLIPLKENKVKYIILASFRVNKMKNDGRVINTIHRYCKNITFKYPTMLKEIQSIGSDEKSYIVSIDWKQYKYKLPSQKL